MSRAIRIGKFHKILALAVVLGLASVRSRRGVNADLVLRQVISARSILVLITVIAAGSLFVAQQDSVAQAATTNLMSYGDVSPHNWEYTFTDPTGDANWNTITGTGTGGWTTGDAPFGFCCSGGHFNSPKTPWPVGSSDTTVNLDAQSNSPTLRAIRFQ